MAGQRGAAHCLVTRDTEGRVDIKGGCLRRGWKTGRRFCRGGWSAPTQSSRTSEEEWRCVGDEMQYALAQSHSWTSKQTHINTLVSSAKSITTPPPPCSRTKTTRKLFYLAPDSKLHSLPGKLINPPFENPGTKERKTKHH